MVGKLSRYAGVVLSVVPVCAYSAGFAVSDKSVSNLGRAFAGGAALAEDASTVYNNPAGMQWIDSTLSLGAHYVSPDISYQSDVPGNGADIGDPKVLPNFYYVHSLNRTSRVGVGIYSPFGLTTEYPAGWEGRYHAIKTELKTVNLSLAYSYLLTPDVSMGLSADAQYLDANLTQALDFSTLAGQPAGTLPDGESRLTGDNVALGYSAGLSARLSAATRLGITYHSSVKQHIAGDARFTGVPNLPPFAVFSNTGAKVNLQLPASATAALSHDFSDSFTGFVDYTWTGWSSYRELRVKFDNALPDSVSRKAWKDSVRYSAGMNYRLSPGMLLRAGYALDESPVPDAQHRDPRTPDSNRRWYAVGLRLVPSEAYSVDLAYSHVINDKARIDNTDALGHVLRGTYENRFDYASVQLNMAL